MKTKKEEVEVAVKSSLYEINEKIQETFLKAIDPETGELLSQEALAELDKLELQRMDKIKGCVYVFKALKDRESTLKAEIDRLTQIKKAITNNKENLRNYLSENVGLNETIKDGIVNISWRKNPLSIDDSDVDIDKLYKEHPEFVKVEMTVKKTELNDYLSEQESTKTALANVKESKEVVLNECCGCKLVQKKGITIR